MAKKYYYSPDTGEIINTDSISDWMVSTTKAPPQYDASLQGCFWHNGEWEIVTAQPDTATRKREILAELAYNDQKIVRALTENDIGRIAAYNIAQKALRTEWRGL